MIVKTDEVLLASIENDDLNNVASRLPTITVRNGSIKIYVSNENEPKIKEEMLEADTILDMTDGQVVKSYKYYYFETLSGAPIVGVNGLIKRNKR